MAPSQKKKMEDPERLEQSIAMIAMMTETKKEELEGLSARDMFIKMMDMMEKKGKNDLADIADTEIVGKAEIDGDTAKLKIKSKGKERTLRFTKEDGKWWVKN